MFLYTKSETLRKNQDNLCYAIFQDNFEVGIYMQKAWHFALCEVFIYKNPDTSKKAWQFALTFLYTKSPTLSLRDFYWIFEIDEVGGAFLYAKRNRLCVKFLYAKIMHLALRFYIQNAWHFALQFYMQKKKCTLRYVLYLKLIV